MKKLWKEFLEFIMTGNVRMLTVAFILGVATKAIVDSFVGNIVQPFVGAIAGHRLVDARGFSDFSDRTTDLFRHGQRTFGYAGDLIGHQCSVELRAHGDTMLYPLLTTTSTSLH